MLDASDRRLLKACAILLVIGATAFGSALWIVLEDGTDVRARVVVGLLGGPLVVGFALFELGRRVVRGPQVPGRHSREDEGP